MRLIKYLAHAGVAARRKSEQLIRDGRVAIDGVVTTDPATVVPLAAEVTVDGQRTAPERRLYYVVHKPVGVVSTAKDTHGRPTVLGLLETNARLYPVGRLDADSSGLILLTNDGDLAHRLLHPSFEVPKSYQVTVAGRLTRDQARQLRQGVQLADGMTAPAQLTPLKIGATASVFRLTIREGRNRQVRRMGEAVGLPVTALKRVRFGPVRLGALRPGEARPLTVRELAMLRALGLASPRPRPGRRPSLRRRVRAKADARARGGG